MADIAEWRRMDPRYLSYKARELREKDCSDDIKKDKLIRVKVIIKFKEATGQSDQPPSGTDCYITEDDTPDELERWIRQDFQFEWKLSRRHKILELGYSTVYHLKDDEVHLLHGSHLPQELIDSKSNSAPAKIYACKKKLFNLFKTPAYQE